MREIYTPVLSHVVSRAIKSKITIVTLKKVIQCPDSQTELLQAPVQPTFPVFGLKRDVLNQLVDLSTGSREDLGISIRLTGLSGVLLRRIFRVFFSINMKKEHYLFKGTLVSHVKVHWI